MVADRITVVTRRAGTEEATRWESTGDGSYTLGAAERPAAGTTVTLHLKPEDEEDGLRDYTRGAGAARTSSSATPTSWRTRFACRARRSTR